MIVIVNYGVGNLGSILNMFKKIGEEAIIASSVAELDKADKILLPGVGTFDVGMKKLQESGLMDVLNEKVLVKKVPVLGICLGMQMMTNSSEEGALPGLNWIEGSTRKFNFDGNQSNLKIPHMGWNQVLPMKSHPLISDLGEDPRYYFVHSYYVHCDQKQDVLLECEYGGRFVCGLQKDNIMGVQFHPEKSHTFGMKLLKNFSKL